MKRAIAVLLLAVAAPAQAWEAQTTHAGLAEQAASGSILHTRLVELGFTGGLYEELTVPPKDAPELLASLDQYAPSGGFVPDERGRQFAVGWLVAGAVLADSSSSWSANHFFDPSNETGLKTSRTALQRLTMLLGEALPPTHGTSAIDWIGSADNPLGLAGFIEQYAKAVRAPTPGERQRHMAAALIAAGAILHVLQDMGSPTHVRNDLDAHLSRLGPDQNDLGSRFERIAALAYGRLGVPPADAVKRPSLRAFFHADDGLGLADLTSTTYFSASTLPKSFSVQNMGKERTALATHLEKALVRPLPSPPAVEIAILRAADRDVAIHNTAGTCLATYRVDDGLLDFDTDDDCMLEQVDAILPQVVGYGAGMIDHLFRGELVVAHDPSASKATFTVQITARSELGAGTVELFSEDARGVRTKLGDPVAVPAAVGGTVLASATAPADAISVVALFTGVDAAGEAIVAAGSGQ